MLPLAGCVTLGKAISLSGFQAPLVSKRTVDPSVYFKGSPLKKKKKKGNGAFFFSPLDGSMPPMQGPAGPAAILWVFFSAVALGPAQPRPRSAAPLPGPS